MIGTGHTDGNVGITGYGAYIPKYRVSVNEIASVWHEDGPLMSKSLNVIEKSVPDLDEDTITISVMATRNAMARAKISASDIGAIYVGSESHPYAVKPSAVTVGEAIGATPVMTAADFEFACKAGSAAMQAAIGLVKSGEIIQGLAIGADCAQGRPGDPLEYTASAGGASCAPTGRSPSPSSPGEARRACRSGAACRALWGLLVAEKSPAESQQRIGCLVHPGPTITL